MLINYYDLPDWMKGNDRILTGYRPLTNNYRKCIKSICMVHNETFNIWSHLLGSVLFLLLLIQLFFETYNPYHKLILAVYCLAVITCFMLSTGYHTFMNHSYEVYKRCLILDFQGILINIFGGSILLLYSIFHEKSQLLFFIYFFFMLSTYSLMNIVVYYPILDGKNGRVYRTILFLSNTFIPIIPIVHCSFINIDDNYITIVQVLSIFFISAFFGCFMYMYRIPETLIDLRYLDYIGNSHNIMHVLVIIIALQMYYGLKILF